jgi:ketosteroid isomerase-like protein
MSFTKHADDEKEIRRLDEEWSKAATKAASNQEDPKLVEDVVAFYAADGSTVWPGDQAQHGTAKIRAGWKAGLKAFRSLQFTPERIDVAKGGDLAIDFGKVAITDKESVMQQGKYVVVWTKIGREWKVLYDCYNMNTG